MPSKKPSKNNSAKKAAAKKSAAKKAVTKKKADKKASAGKSTHKGTQPESAKGQEKGSVQGNGQNRPKASELIKRASHTPAIFKPNSKRTTHILFSMDDVRDLLKKRSREEKQLADSEFARQEAAQQGNKPQTVVEDSTPRNSKHQAATLDDILGISAPKQSAKAGTGNIPKKFEKYYNLLVELRDHVRAELNLHSNDTLKRSQKEDAGDISISVDAGTDNFDRDFALSLLSSEQESLKEIEAAIQRIFDGTYGICEVTGEQIKDERLEAVPFTRFSLDGQRQYEMTSRKRVTRTGAFLNEASGETISFGDDDGDN